MERGCAAGTGVVNIICQCRRVRHRSVATAEMLAIVCHTIGVAYGVRHIALGENWNLQCECDRFDG